MAAVNHDVRGDSRLDTLPLAMRHTFGIKIRDAVTATQYDVCVSITGCMNDRNFALWIYAQKAVRTRNSFQCIDGNFKTTICTVLETSGRTQATRHFAMCLRFGSTCA